MSSQAGPWQIVQLLECIHGQKRLVMFEAYNCVEHVSPQRLQDCETVARHQC
jgi:hypothetical protein